MRYDDYLRRMSKKDERRLFSKPDVMLENAIDAIQNTASKSTKLHIVGR